jgi:hypothetical protein
MTIEIVVDELVLRGVQNERAHDVADAMKARLEALGEGSTALASRDEAFRRAPDAHAPSSSAAALGEAVAGSVWHAVGGGRS